MVGITTCAVCGEPIGPGGGSYEYDGKQGKICARCFADGRFEEAFK